MTEKRLTYVILMNNYCQIREVDGNDYCRRLSPTRIIDLLNEQQARVEMLEKGILDCLFNNKSIGILAEEMELVE